VKQRTVAFQPLPKQTPLKLKRANAFKTFRRPGRAPLGCTPSSLLRAPQRPPSPTPQPSSPPPGTTAAPVSHTSAIKPRAVHNLARMCSVLQVIAALCHAHTPRVRQECGKARAPWGHARASPSHISNAHPHGAAQDAQHTSRMRLMRGTAHRRVRRPRAGCSAHARAHAFTFKHACIPHQAAALCKDGIHDVDELCEPSEGPQGARSGVLPQSKHRVGKYSCQRMARARVGESGVLPQSKHSASN